jgi:hypothetical protein
VASVAFNRQVAFTRLHAYEFRGVPKWNRIHFFAQKVDSLRRHFSLGEGPKRETNTIDVFDVLLGVRNRGIGHGGIPRPEEAQLIEEVCKAIGSSCDRLATPRVLVTNDIRAANHKIGDFIFRGVLYSGESEELWEKRTSYEDLLPLKALHIVDNSGNPLFVPPFLQIEARTFWFLQRYRRGGKSLFTDFRTTQNKSDSNLRLAPQAIQ